MTSILVVIALHVVAVLVLTTIFVLPERIRMERRSQQLLRAHPGAGRKSVYLSFPTVMGKRAAMDAKIAEVEADGWTFLRATEANPWRTLRSWGGGLTLQFIRPFDVVPVSMPSRRTDQPVA
ncbi:MAG: hypothetical protein IT581_18935 [Verrucomicrobiales bacterium]|nr:hypothetical protein [Verrucomicrobiales bacterium]